MKKKIALLLALSMILSILPMNVFGATKALPTSVQRISEDVQFVGGYRLEFDMNDFYRVASNEQIGDFGGTSIGNGKGYVAVWLQLDGGIWSDKTGAETADKWGGANLSGISREDSAVNYGFTSGAAIRVADSAELPYTWALHVVNGTLAELRIYDLDPTNTGDPFGASNAANATEIFRQNAVVLDVPLYFTAWGDTTTVGLTSSSARFTTSKFTLAQKTGRGVTVAAGTKVSFNSVAYLNRIRIGENVFGDINGNSFTVRLEVPANFRWSYLSTPAATPQYSGAYYNNNFTLGGDFTVNYSGDRRVAYLTFNIDRPVTGLPSYIDVTGLRIDADERAPYGDITVVSRVGSGGLAAWAAAANTSNINIVPAQRVQNELRLSLRNNATPPELVAGRIGTAVNNVALNATGDNNVIWDTGNWGQRTATVMLDELAPNAWGSSRGYETYFRVPDGVTITRAQVIGYFYQEGWVGEFPTIINDASARETWEGTWRAAQRDTSYRDQWGVMVKPSYVLISNPVQNTDDLNRLRRVMVTLDLSIEPGYVEKYETSDIEITVDGYAVENLAENTIVAATVYDPVSVEVPDLSDVITSNTSYNAHRSPVGDIIITEAKAGELKQNSEIWLYIVGNRQFDIDFNCNRTATTNFDESGLRLHRGSDLRFNYAGLSFVGVKFEVERASYKVPGVITITDAEITGWVYPNVDYKIVVSGNAVAQNNYDVFAYATSDARAKEYSHILYDGAPYSASLFKFDSTTALGSGGSDVTPPPTSVTPPAEEPTAPAEPTEPTEPALLNPSILSIRRFNSSTSYIYENDGSTYAKGTVSAAPIFTTVPDPNGTSASGYIKFSVFADAMGLDALWNAATGEGTIQGYDANNNFISVVVKNNDNIAMVNGTPVPIMSGANSDVNVPALIMNGSFFVPARFVMNVFGVPVSWDAATSTVGFN